jgi:hypothetical protein
VIVRWIIDERFKQYFTIRKKKRQNNITTSTMEFVDAFSR